MNTQEIADKLVAYNKEGKFPQVFEDLYSDDFVSIEMPGADYEVAQGLDEVNKKGEWFFSMFEMISVEVSEPLVADNWFAVRYKMHTKNQKTGEEEHSSELGVYRVQDGKVVQEQFFYDTPE